MLCYTCSKFKECETFKSLARISTDFSIKQCNTYDALQLLKYRKIAENDDLMHLIYDYFLDCIQGGFTKEEAEKAIRNALIDF